MLNQFKQKFSGGTRSNRFEITGNIPTGGAFTKFHIRSTIIPQITSTTIEYSYFGRKFYYPGEKQYSTWSFNVLDDNPKNASSVENLWSMFHTWQNTINNHVTNRSYDLSNANNNSYKANSWTIRHLNLNDQGSALKEFIMHGCWPTSVEPMPLNMSSNNLLNSFNVIMVYDYIELRSAGGTSNNNSGNASTSITRTS
jgi:hypothetical protein